MFCPKIKFQSLTFSTENIFLLGWPSSFNVAVLNCSDFLEKKKKKRVSIRLQYIVASISFSPDLRHGAEIKLIHN